MFKFDVRSSEEEPERDLPIVLLGGSSFIGLNTAQTLFYYYDIFCSYFKSEAPNYYPEYIWTRLNALQPKTSLKALTSIIKRSKAKFVINLISGIESSHNNFVESNFFTFNKNFITVCNKLEVNPIFISNDLVFSGLEGHYKENAQPNPSSKSRIGIEKCAIENLLHEFSNSFIILRLSTMLGLNLHFQRQNTYSRLVSSIKNNIEVEGAIDKFFTPSHVYNVAFLIHKIIDTKIEDQLPPKLICHLPGEFISEFELFRKIALSHKCDEELIIPVEITNPSKEEPMRFGLNSFETEKQFPTRFLTLEEGLKILNSDIENTIKN